MTRWLWAAGDGSSTDLSDWAAGTYVLDDGTSGELAPDYEFATQSFAGVDGEDLQQINVGPRTLTLGMDLVASDGAELRARVRRLAHVLRPRLGEGTLRAVADDGTERSLPCYYRKGLDAGTYRVTRYRCTLEFWAPRPWWRGERLRQAWSLAAPTAFFPIPPVRLSATTITGAATVDLSDTDAPTYPTWTITGPGSQLTLRNESTGAVLVLTAPIGDGELVVIETRPGRQSVRRATGTPPAVAEARRNLVPNPAPGSATSYTANYGTGGAGALSYIGSGGPAGAGFVRATWSTASTAVGSGQIRHDGRATQPLPIPVTPGQVLSAATQARSSIGQRLALVVTWFDAAGGQTGITPTSNAGAAVAADAGAWVRLTAEGITVPPGAAYCLLGPQAVSGTGAVVWPVGATLDQAQTQLEVATAAGAYFDGSTVAAAGVSYVWTGTVSASQSVQSTVGAAGGVTLGANLFGSLGSDPALWPLTDGVNVVTATLSNAGAASSVTLEADRLYSGAR